MVKRLVLLVLAGLLMPAVATRAQQQAAPQPPPAAAAPAAAAPARTNPTTVCGQPFPTPPAIPEPPANSGPIVFQVAPCFEAQGQTSLVDIQTYLFYMQIKDHISRPTQGVWVPYNEEIEQIIRDDFKRLWGTNFLDNLSIETEDYVFSNGVVGKLITYNMEERQRVKIVDYVGSKKIETTKIDEKLKEANAQIRLDTFIDPGLVKKVEGIVRGMLVEKGFQRASVTHEIQEVQGGPKLVHLTFHMDEGPKVKIQKIDFIGNQAIADGKLRKQMKENRAHWWLSWITGRGTYQENKFEEDAERVTEYYRDNGYVKAQVGEPQLRDLGDSADKKTHWVELRIPVTEGPRYKVRSFDVAGNKVVKTEALKPLFKLTPGEYYNQKTVRKGFQKAQEIYGTLGYMEFTGFPDYKFSDDPAQPAGATTGANGSDGKSATDGTDGKTSGTNGTAATDGKTNGTTATDGKTNGTNGTIATDGTKAAADNPLPRLKAGEPTVDVTLQIQEGKQYFVNRIVFTGNTTTRDNVIRRELRLYENGIFNTQALQFSIKRLNQLGYFKALEGPPKDVTVEKLADKDNLVDVKMKLEEQNRNQLTFGAGVSQFEGFFGQLSFQTANFLGRGESFTVSLQGGSRAQNYSLAFTEPFLFDRNITGGANVFRSNIRYIGQFTQESTGGVLTFGFPVGNGFTRMFTNYSYEHVRVSEINGVYCDPVLLARNPFLRDSLLLGGASCVGNTTINDTFEVSGGGQRIISKVTPSLVYNTVDQPIFPTSGKRLTLSMDVAGLGGNTNFLEPTVEGVAFFKENARMSFGMRGQFQYVRKYGSTLDLPIFQKLFLGGEYSVRGFDLRTIGPSDPLTGLVLGGNKSLLFNAEQIITIAGPVRLILFYDAGQVRDEGQPFAWKENATRVVTNTPLLYDPLATISITDPNVPTRIEVIGQRSAFKTSTGAEIRFFMPVLNVPFRLIFAYNPQRGGVLDNQLQPQKAFQFRFAVGTTF
jgi:outer membrane protein assembly complex protein YaeT